MSERESVLHASIERVIVWPNLKRAGQVWKDIQTKKFPDFGRGKNETKQRTVKYQKTPSRTLKVFFAII